MAYRVGLAAVSPELLGGLFLCLSAIFFIPLYLRTRIFTIPQFLQLRYSARAKLFYAWGDVLKSTLGQPITTYVGALAILGILGFEVTPPNILLCAAIVTGSIGLYAILGGMSAVIVTDLIQVIIIVLGGTAVVIGALIKVGGPIELYNFVGSQKFELLLPRESPNFAWDAVVFGNGTASALWAICSISMLQRALSARSIDDAKKGMLFGGFLKLMTIGLYAIPGIAAIKLFPGISPDIAYPTIVNEVLPMGLRSLVIAALLAALMSSADSGMNATAGLVALDIIPAMNKNVSEKVALLIGKLLVGATMTIGVILAPFILGFDTAVYELVLKVGGFLTLPAGICFLFGRFVKRVNGFGAVTTLIVGMTLGTYYVICSSVPELSGALPRIIRETQFYRIYPFFFILLCLVIMVSSLFAAPPTPQQLACLSAKSTVGTPDRPVGQPLIKSFRFWFGIYLLCFFALYLIF